MAGFPISTPYFGQRPQVDPWLGWPVAATPQPSYAGQLPAPYRPSSAGGGGSSSQPALTVEDQGPNDRPLTRLLAKLRDRRQARGKETGFLDAWLNAGGVGSGYLRDRYNQLGADIDAGNRPFLAALRDNSNALMLAGSGMRQGPGGFGQGFAQGAQIDQQNADYRRQMAAQQAYRDAVSQATANAPANLIPLLNANPDLGAQWAIDQYSAQPGPMWEPYTSPEGWRGQRNTTTGEVNWDPQGMQPQGEAEPGYRWLTGEEIAALNEQGIAVDPNRPYQLNLQTGEVAPVGSAASGLRIVSDGQGGFTIEQGPGVTGGGTGTVDSNAARVYAGRMAAAEEVLSQVENAGTSLAQHILGGLPLGNYLVSEDYQRYQQAQRDFLNAVLRRESGAVISEEEFANGRLQYFPQPGDSPAVIEQKRRNRQLAIQLIGQAAGQEYAAPTPAVQQPTQPAQPQQTQATPAAPPVGTIEQGDGGQQFEFLGGDPADPNNWRPIQGLGGNDPWQQLRGPLGGP